MSFASGFRSALLLGAIALVAPRALAQSEQIIEDPELRGVPTAPVRVSEAESPANFRFELHSRFGVDTRWENDREDVIEATQIGMIEATYRKSDALRFAVGFRARHHYTQRQRATVEGDPARYELDVVPTAGYADATIGDGVHVRTGYQIVSMGRFDFLSATNFLAVYDVRDGLTTMPDASEFAQLALRIDVDLASWLTLQSYYIPFFQPHLVSVYGTDHALLKAVEDDDRAKRSSLKNLLIQRSELGMVSNSTFRAFGPQAGPHQPQGAMRLSARGRAGELAFTAGTALERLPTLVLNERVEALVFYVPEPGQDITEQYLNAILESERPFSIKHGRFSVLAMDGATDIGPFQIGFEAAYMNDRMLYAGKPGRLAVPGQVDMAHGALRAEYAREDFLLTLEGFADYALAEPTDPTRDWITLESGRLQRGVAGVTRWRPGGGRLSLEAVAMVFSGPTVFVTPRLELKVSEALWFELGAHFVEGPDFGLANPPTISIGDVYDDIDQVFAGFRWVP